MLVSGVKSEDCPDCGVRVTLRTYEGLPDVWYTEHHCDPEDVKLKVNELYGGGGV